MLAANNLHNAISTLLDVSVYCICFTYIVLYLLVYIVFVLRILYRIAIVKLTGKRVVIIIVRMHCLLSAFVVSIIYRSPFGFLNQVCLPYEPRGSHVKSKSMFLFWNVSTTCAICFLSIYMLMSTAQGRQRCLHKKRTGRDKIYPKSTKDTFSMIYHLLLSFVTMNYSRVHEAILKERGGATQMGTLKISLPRTPSLQISRLLLLSIITLLFKF